MKIGLCYEHKLLEDIFFGAHTHELSILRKVLNCTEKKKKVFIFL